MNNQGDVLGGEVYEAVNEANLGRPLVVFQAVGNAATAELADNARFLGETASA